MTNADHEGTIINCLFCEHFHLTREARFPYGCRALGFKTFRMPSVDVFYASEKDCTLFVRKVIDRDHHDGGDG